MQPKRSPGHTSRVDMTDRIVASLDTLMHGQMREHATELVEIDITMAQAKALYLVSAAGPLRMSELAAHLGVTSSTATGLVDRLVELDLVERHGDPDDRRQVVVAATPAALALLERFRELNGAQLRRLLARVPTAELPLIEEAIGALLRASQDPPPVTPKGARHP